MDEFDIIRRYFVPLAEGYAGAIGLSDDAALISIPASRALVVTKDAITEGVHFLGNEDAGLIARKLLRVNLSDLAAKGAEPLCYFLALMLPENTEEAWIARFASGLAADQKLFHIHLGGGDTTAIKGKLALSLTALGTVRGQMLTRSGAKPGDDIYVSGTLGDAAYGLACLKGSQPRDTAIEERYLLPQPRLALGQALLEQRIASACMDISDGLTQDLGHICAASGVSATIEAECVPRTKASVETALTGGDDYELLFTAAGTQKGNIAALSKQMILPLTRIGTIKEGKGIQVLDTKGNPLTLQRTGYRHFSGGV